MNDFREGESPEGLPLLEGSWGYAILRNGKIWIPAMIAKGFSKEIIDELVRRFNSQNIVFSAILNRDKMRKSFKNIIREWDEYFPEIDDYSPCMEIVWVNK